MAASVEESSGENLTELASRLDEIAAAVDAWESASDLPAAQAAAEEARNLVTGVGVLDAGDLDGDGVIAGEREVGLLPAPGSEEGVALVLQGCEAIDRDILGGAGRSPEEVWDEAAQAIAAWTESDNTMPTLKSHPQRIVGWATFTLGKGAVDDVSLELANEFAGHAQIHVRVAREALAACS